MALTTPRGFTGGPMADFDYGVGAAGGAWVETAAALAVTQPNTGTRTVAIAAGTACAYGVRVSNDAAIGQALAAPSSGGAWYLLALRFNWSNRTVTLQVLPGPTSGSTAIPTVIPGVLPATAVSSPGTGTGYDLPLAWAFVESADTTVTLFDVRMRTQLNEPIASTPQALAFAALQNTPPLGMLIPSISDGITYRWSQTPTAGTALASSPTGWRAWESDWIQYNGDWVGISGTRFGSPGYVPGGRYRYSSGKVRYEFGVLINGGGTSSSGTVTVSVPVAADQYGAFNNGANNPLQRGFATHGRGWRTVSSNGRNYDFLLRWASATTLTFGVINSAQYLDGAGSGLAQSDEIVGVIEYDPA